MTFSTSSKSAQWSADASAMQVLLLLLLGVVLWSIYSPGLSGPYVFDDFQNITRNPSLKIESLSSGELFEAAFSKAEGGLGRPIAMVSFALNYFVNGKTLDPFAFKLTNLLIHMANVLLVYVLLRLLFESASITFRGQNILINRRHAVILATFSTALWGLHPLQLTSVLYTVQRMTSLSAFFVVSGLLLFLLGRRTFSSRTSVGIMLMMLGIGGGTALGLLCKENAILLPLLAATIEFSLLSRNELNHECRRKLVFFYIIFLAIPAALGVGFIIFNSEFIQQTYATRNFDLTERVLTESRVLFFYLSLIIFPLISRFGLFHDDFPLSTGLLDPISTLFALIAWAIIAVALFRGLRQRAMWAFGLAWFLAGHALESSILGLEIIHEHRNYVPSIGICAAGAFYIFVLFEKFKLSARGITICSFSVLLTLAFITHTRALSWTSRAQLFDSLVQHHPKSYRAINGLATSMVEQGRDVRPVYSLLRDSALANPSTVYPLIEMKKILHALVPISEYFDNSQSEALVSHGSRTTWTSELVLDRKYLFELDSALSPEIARRLREGGIHAETVNALRTAQECVKGGGDACASLASEALDWHLALLARLPSKDPRRGMLELSAAKIYAATGDLDQALAYTDRSIETTSGHPRYLAQKAMLLIQLGAIEQAEEITDLIVQKMDWRKIYAGDVRVLRREIEYAKLGREQASLGVSSREIPLVSPF